MHSLNQILLGTNNDNALLLFVLIHVDVAIFIDVLSCDIHALPTDGFIVGVVFLELGDNGVCLFVIDCLKHDTEHHLIESIVLMNEHILNELFVVAHIELLTINNRLNAMISFNRMLDAVIIDQNAQYGQHHVIVKIAIVTIQNQRICFVAISRTDFAGICCESHMYFLLFNFKAQILDIYKADFNRPASGCSV